MSGKYIITFKDHVTQEEINKAINDLQINGGYVVHRYTLLNGFSATIPDTQLQLFQSLQGDAIESIEPDSTVSIQ